MAFFDPPFLVQVAQLLVPKCSSERFEGIAFSPCGHILGVATSDTNAVLLFRRQADGLFEEAPYRRLEHLKYPHDLSFTMLDGAQILAVAQRAGAIAVY